LRDGEVPHRRGRKIDVHEGTGLEATAGVWNGDPHLPRSGQAVDRGIDEVDPAVAGSGAYVGIRNVRSHAHAHLTEVGLLNARDDPDGIELCDSEENLARLECTSHDDALFHDDAGNRGPQREGRPGRARARDFIEIGGRKIPELETLPRRVL